MFSAAHRCFLLVVLACLSVQAFAADPPPMMQLQGPVPIQIMTAKKIFIANNAGDNSADDQKRGKSDQSYDLFYAAMRSWGRYQLVSSPAAADLVFDLRLDHGEVTGRLVPDVDPHLSLAILDPGTRMSLWTLTESFDLSDNAYFRALAALVQDLKNLGVRAEAQSPNDATIATIMGAINQIDMDFAKTSLGKSKNPGLRAFAQQVIADDTAIQKSIQDIVQKLNLKPAGNYTSDWLTNQSDKVKDKLIASNGKSLDKYYIADEIQFSQTIATMIADTLLPNAQNPDLKAVLANAQPVMLAHLSAAQKLVSMVDALQKDSNNWP